MRPDVFFLFVFFQVKLYNITGWTDDQIKCFAGDQEQNTPMPVMRFNKLYMLQERNESVLGIFFVFECRRRFVFGTTAARNKPGGTISDVAVDCNATQMPVVTNQTFVWCYRALNTGMVRHRLRPCSSTGLSPFLITTSLYDPLLAPTRRPYLDSGGDGVIPCC